MSVATFEEVPILSYIILFLPAPFAGTGPNEFEGNIRYRKLVRDVLTQACFVDDERIKAKQVGPATAVLAGFPRITPALPKEKPLLAARIVQTVKERNGRFLQKLPSISGTPDHTVERSSTSLTVDGEKATEMPGKKPKEAYRDAGAGGGTTKSAAVAASVNVSEEDAIPDSCRYKIMDDAIAIEKTKQTFRHQMKIIERHHHGQVVPCDEKQAAMLALLGPASQQQLVSIITGNKRKKKQHKGNEEASPGPTPKKKIRNNCTVSGGSIPSMITIANEAVLKSLHEKMSAIHAALSGSSKEADEVRLAEHEVLAARRNTLLFQGGNAPSSLLFGLFSPHQAVTNSLLDRSLFGSNRDSDVMRYLVGRVGATTTPQIIAMVEAAAATPPPPTLGLSTSFNDQSRVKNEISPGCNTLELLLARQRLLQQQEARKNYYRQILSLQEPPGHAILDQGQRFC